MSEALQKIASSSSSMASRFSNDREAMRVTWNMIRKNLASTADSLGPVLAMVGLSDNDKLKEWVDVSLMPDFDKISKYFSFTVMSETPTAEGMSFKAVAPLPPELRK